MGKVVEKRKKGRPSLLDLQKRTIKQQLQHHQPNPNPNPNHNSTSHRRSTRRNPNPGDNTDATGEDDDDGGLNGKLKVVLKFPSPLNSASLNSGSYGGDSNIEVDDYGTNHKKQKLNGIGDGSGDRDTEEAEKHVSTTNSANTPQGTQLDMGPSTPLPDKKLLLFILDRLQKKDTYGVFAEPVDPEELPDYHEVVEHPMDFGTARKNLGGGAYASLEQFEKDVFLICSNAMQYNSPETIYYRQARYIQEMAKKYFKDLRQESDDNEPERKIVRRGRPPTKNLKKQIGRPPLERVSSQFSSDALLGTGSDNTIKLNFDPTKGPVSDKPGRSDFSVRSQNSETYSHWLAEQKSERNAKITGSIPQLSWAKRGKKQFVFDESRRNTYTQSHISSGVQEPSVLTTFDGQRKQLMAVGLHTEYGYARSLARFGANLGPDAWKVVSKKIEKSLPVGVKFGPGWVGDIEEVQLKSLPILSTSSVQPPPSSSSLSKPISRPENSFAAATPSSLEIRTEKLSEISEGNKLVASTHSTVNSEQPNKPRTVSSAPTSTPINVTESANPLRGMNSHTNTSTMNRSVNMIRPRPLIEIHHPSMNGLTSPRMGLQTHPHWQQVSVQMKKDAVPPDLNIRFQSPGSPTLSRADSMQPDLVLQL